MPASMPPGVRAQRGWQWHAPPWIGAEPAVSVGSTRLDCARSRTSATALARAQTQADASSSARCSSEGCTGQPSHSSRALHWSTREACKRDSVARAPVTWGWTLSPRHWTNATDLRTASIQRSGAFSRTTPRSRRGSSECWASVLTSPISWTLPSELGSERSRLTTRGILGFRHCLGVIANNTGRSDRAIELYRVAAADDYPNADLNLDQFGAAVVSRCARSYRDPRIGLAGLRLRLQGVDRPRLPPLLRLRASPRLVRAGGQAD